MAVLDFTKCVTSLLFIYPKIGKLSIENLSEQVELLLLNNFIMEAKEKSLQLLDLRMEK